MIKTKKSINFICFKYKMRKTANSLDHTKLNSVHSKQSTQPYKKGLATFQSCMPMNQKSHLTPTREQILEQACSTTFTSKIFQFSNCQSKESSDAISPSKSQTEIQNKKKKINVTASLIKMKTESAESVNPKLTPNIHPIKAREEISSTSNKLASTNDNNKKCVTAVNPEKSFDQKQQILKKLGGKKTSDIKYPFIQEFSPKKMKENCSVLRSEKKINHMKKRNLQLQSEQNLVYNCGQKVKTEIDGSWVVLRQSSDYSGWGNKNDETPINRLLEEDQEMFFRKPKFFCDQ